MPSVIQIDTILAKDGTQTTEPSIPALDKRMAAAWVNFDGTAASIVPSDGYNVASITDNGVGLFALNLITPLPSVNCAVGGSVGNPGSTNVGFITNAGSNLTPPSPTTTQVPVKTLESGATTLVLADWVKTDVFVFA